MGASNFVFLSKFVHMFICYSGNLKFNNEEALSVKKLHRKQHGVVFNSYMMKLFLKPTVSRVSGCLSLPVILKLHAGMMVAAIQTITIHLLTIQTTCNETSSQSLEQYMFKLL